MDVDEKLIKRLLPLDESGWLDFKRKPHAVFHKDSKVQSWAVHELIKDIAALANGNQHSVGHTAYLIYGVDDNFNADRSRDLFDIGDFDLTSKQIHGWLKNKVAPRITGIQCYPVIVDKKKLFVIEISASEDVHETLIELKTGQTQSSLKHTVFYRGGEDNDSASMKEISTLRRAKLRYFKHASYVHPVWAITLSMGGTAAFIYWTVSPALFASNAETLPFLDKRTAVIIGTVLGTAIFTFMGWGIGKLVVDLKELVLIWLQASNQKRFLIAIIMLTCVVLMLTIFWVVNYLFSIGR